MMIDRSNQFSDDQAITATAASTDYYNQGTSTIGYGLAGKSNLYAYVVVKEDFNTLTSLNIALQTDTVSNFASPTTLHDVDVVLANLVDGAAVFVLELGAQPLEQYIRFNYTVTGTDPTTGKLDAFLAESVPFNNK